MDRVVFFDVDGTLTAAGTSSTDAFLAALKGDEAQVVAAEAAYARGELTNQQRSWDECDECDERDAALAVAAVHGVTPARCLALGDSRSDLPLFAAVGGSIAVKASADCVAAASTSLMTQDLTDAIPLLDDLAASGR